MCVDLLVDGLGHTDASGGSDRLQSRCDVHAIAIDAVVLHDHVAKMDADPGLDPFVRPRLALATACASWIACAQRTALTTVSNSPNTESPAVFDDTPLVRFDEALSALVEFADQGRWSAPRFVPSCG